MKVKKLNQRARTIPSATCMWWVWNRLYLYLFCFCFWLKCLRGNLRIIINIYEADLGRTLALRRQILEELLIFKRQISEQLIPSRSVSEQLIVP